MYLKVSSFYSFLVLYVVIVKGSITNDSTISLNTYQLTIKQPFLIYFFLTIYTDLEAFCHFFLKLIKFRPLDH